MSTYAELKEWQTGIGALLGFLALMLAALWNFHLSRKRDAALRSEEMLSISVALYGEVLSLREELARLARIVAQYYHRGEDVPMRLARDFCPPNPILYPSLGHKLGMLPSELVLAITKFHASFRRAKDSLPLICKEDDFRTAEDGVRYPVSGVRYREDGTRYSVLTFLRPAVSGVEDIAPALRQIERLAGLHKAKEPDLGNAADVVEVEEKSLS